MRLKLTTEDDITRPGFSRLYLLNREPEQPGSYYIQWYFHTCGFICQILINGETQLNKVRQKPVIMQIADEDDDGGNGVCLWSTADPTRPLIFIHPLFISSFGSKDENKNHKKRIFLNDDRDGSLIITKHLMCINNFLVSSGRRTSRGNKQQLLTIVRYITCTSNQANSFASQPIRP